MRIIKTIIKKSLATGFLTVSAFTTGVILGSVIKKDKFLKKIKKLQYKENKSASSK
ncbi:MAG: hypothetical protein ACJ0GH_01845 [Alphaproteobacteria bacterium]|tara:strand:+ start:573 stop:740 length:168 start_codon:yes stop_codon:yes gene_type:complete